jgi:PhnB protein
MAPAVRPVPEGYHSVTPYLCVKGANQAIEFYKKAFGATEVTRLQQPDGSIAHAEIQIGDSRIMLTEDAPQMQFRSPDALGGSPVLLHLYVEDADATYARAVAAGAQPVRPVQDQFYGDRGGGVKDPFGHSWFLSTHKEDLSEEEITRRAAAVMGG